MPISAVSDLFWRRMDTGGVLFVSVLLSYTLSHYVFSLNVALVLTIISTSGFLFGLRELRAWKAGEPAPRGNLSAVISSGVVIYLVPLVWQSTVDLTHGKFKAPGLAFGAISSLLVGVTLFCFAFPQSYYPEHFSTVGTAHHYLHITLVLANVCEFFFLLDMYDRQIT
jgi:predicted membrane channel-forming protein YqfA (hemolysin III family)